MSCFATSLSCAVTGWEDSVTSEPSLNWPLIFRKSRERWSDVSLMIAAQFRELDAPARPSYSAGIHQGVSEYSCSGREHERGWVRYDRAPGVASGIDASVEYREPCGPGWLRIISMWSALHSPKTRSHMAKASLLKF